MTNEEDIPPAAEEHIRNFERAVVDGDIATMADALGELHERWDALDGKTQTDILKFDAIFLTILNARVKQKGPENHE